MSHQADTENSAATSASRAVLRLAHLSTLYIVWASVGGIVAIVQDRPAGFAGQESGLAVWKDFVFGMGTALSPTAWWIALQSLLTWWTRRSDGLRTVAIYGLTLFGFGEFIGALGEPITYAIFRPETFNPFLAVVQGGMIVLPAAIMWLGAVARRAIQR
jgi:hypothetical protein